MITFSFIPKENEFENFKTIYNQLREKGISGIETIIGDHLDFSEYKNYPIKGVHLLYYPTWLEFWKGDWKKVKEDFYDDEGIKNYYRSFKKNILIETFKEQFENAKKIDAEYMVFHVSHVRPKDIFQFDFQYTDLEVLDECIKIVNEVFKGEGPLLLFENLPWPGLNFRDYELTRYFIQKVKYKNKGFLLDFSHLICLEREVTNFEEANKFIIDRIGKMKELKDYIFGLHVNGVKFDKFLDCDFQNKISEWEKGDRYEKFQIELNHMKNIDPHLLYKGNINEIIKYLPNFKYINLELGFSSLLELKEKVLEQLNYLKINF
ncbi:TIM barrel protein [uncultured Cetobacterium sp.]|uniref:TIM barrel protein n=1 Tax=uncultured Cetobacterium sp. TaxID=527638 RepID=UPI0025CE6850|nr:TIM barrel protein [uncultured Cetobacterium sp.]